MKDTEFWHCDKHNSTGNHEMGCPHCKKENDAIKHLKLSNEERMPTNDISQAPPATVMIRSLFSGWHESTKEQALEWAKFKLKNITTCKNDEERLAIINGRLQGIQFVLSQLI